MSSDKTKYVCPLDAATQKKALDELYEDPKNRQGAIDTFRDWIKQQKHIKCPMDDVFLLGFLRAKHFSQLEARAALEYFMVQRDKLASWTKNLDPSAAEFDSIIEKAVMIMLPSRDTQGRKVIIFRPGILDFGNKAIRLAFFRFFPIACYYNYLCDEMTQVHGTVYLADFTGHTMANEMKTPIEDKKNITGLMQKTFPSRVKGFHMYNTGVMLEFIMGLIGRLFTDKLKKRLKFHNHGLETVYGHIPMDILPEEYLPDDYSKSSAGSMDHINTTMKAELCRPEIRDRIKYLSSEDFYIKMNQKESDVPVASFRKLNVD